MAAVIVLSSGSDLWAFDEGDDRAQRQLLALNAAGLAVERYRLSAPMWEASRRGLNDVVINDRRIGEW